MAYIAGLFMFLCLAMGGTGYWYYNDTQDRIATLQANNAKLETAIAVSEESIKVMQADAAKQAELNLQLQADLQKAEAYGDELRNTLRKHNLTALALKKPALIEKRMNNATEKLWNDLVADTTPSGVLDATVDEQPSGTESSNSN